MAESENLTQFWERFCTEKPHISGDESYQSWYFGNSPEMASDLAALVICGEKTATASLEAVNRIKPQETPIPDGYSVVTDFFGEPLCVIQTVEIRHIPFDEVDPQFASDEGEGDQSLEFWRIAHHAYFTREAAELGVDFDERSLICCERFRLLYPK